MNQVWRGACLLDRSSRIQCLLCRFQDWSPDRASTRKQEFQETMRLWKFSFVTWWRNRTHLLADVGERHAVEVDFEEFVCELLELLYGHRQRHLLLHLLATACRLALESQFCEKEQRCIILNLSTWFFEITNEVIFNSTRRFFKLGIFGWSILYNENNIKNLHDCKHCIIIAAHCRRAPDIWDVGCGSLHSVCSCSGLDPRRQLSNSTRTSSNSPARRLSALATLSKRRTRWSSEILKEII